jgi:DNA-directed RNA polymerase subunit L
LYKKADKISPRNLHMKHFYQSIPQESQIDAENGIIRKCSLIRLGAAEGHFDKEGRQETVDQKTLEQVYLYCYNSGSVKVKLDHGSGVLSTVGYVKNFAIEDGKVVGDFHIYETANEKPRILEVAEKNPNHMGMSLEFEGQDEVSGDKAFSRCSRVLTVALVSDPAANTSLFSALPTETKTTTPIMAEDKTEPTVSLEDRINELSKKFEDMATKFAKKFEEDETKNNTK